MKLLAIDIAEFDEAEIARNDIDERKRDSVTRSARSLRGSATAGGVGDGDGGFGDDDDGALSPSVPVNAPSDTPLGFGKAFMAMLPHDVLSESSNHLQTGFGLTHKWEKRRKERSAQLHEAAEASMVAAGGAGLASSARKAGSTAAAAEALSTPRAGVGATPRPGVDVGGGGDGVGAGGGATPRLAPPHFISNGVAVASSKTRVSKFANMAPADLEGGEGR